MERKGELHSEEFQRLLTEIGNELQPHDVERFKHILRDRLPPSILDDIDSHGRNSVLEFLKKLQVEGYLAEDNLELLKELLPAITRHDLLEKLYKFENKRKTLKNTSSDEEATEAMSAPQNTAPYSFSRIRSILSTVWGFIRGRCSSRSSSSPPLPRRGKSYIRDFPLSRPAGRLQIASADEDDDLSCLAGAHIYDGVPIYPPPPPPPMDLPNSSMYISYSSDTSSTGKEFQEPWTEIGYELLPNDVEYLRYSLQDNLPPSVLDDVDSREMTSGLQFLLKLQEEGYPAEDILKLLREFARGLDRYELLEKIEKKVKELERTSSDVGVTTVRPIAEKRPLSSKHGYVTISGLKSRFKIDVEGGFYDLPSLGVLLQIPPNAVTRPTLIRCENLSASDSYPQTEEYECLVSYCIRIYAPIPLKRHIIVALKHSGPSNNEGFESILKALDSWGKTKWEEIKGIRETPFVRKHIKYIGVKIRKWSDLVVVTRPITYTFEVTKSGHCFSCTSQKVKVEFPEGAVDKTYKGSIKMLPMPDHIDILEGIAAYPSSMLLIDGFEGVSFEMPVKITLPHPYPAGYPYGNVRLLTMKTPHQWKDITDQVNCVENKSFIELEVSHFSGLWVWIFEVPLAVASSLSRYLFNAPQDVCFAVFKENEVYNDTFLTMTLLCVPNHEQFEKTDAMEKQGYKQLASATANKTMRPGDKAYTKVEGCYEKKLKKDFLLRFIENDICRQEIPLVRKSYEKEKDVSRSRELIISLLENEGDDLKDTLCTFCIDETKLVPRLPEKGRSPELQKVETVGLESALPGPSGLCSSGNENHPITRTPSTEGDKNQKVVSIPGIEVPKRNNIDAESFATILAGQLNLDKVALQDPPKEIVQKCRKMCIYLKKEGMVDVIKELRKKLPSGMTGPLQNEDILVESMIGSLQDLTRALCGDDMWKKLAEHLDIRRCHFDFHGRKDNPVQSILEDVCCKRKLTVVELYDVLCKCGANAIADEFL